MLFAQNNVMITSSKRHQCHQNCCLNKPYFYVKMHQIHSSVHTFHISLAILIHTQREKLCHRALSYQQTIRLFVSLYSNPHFVRLFIDALAWPHFNTGDGEHIAGVICRIALQHLWWLDPPWNQKAVCFQLFLSEVSRRVNEITVHIGNAKLFRRGGDLMVRARVRVMVSLACRL